MSIAAIALLTLSSTINVRAEALAAFFPAGHHGHWQLAPAPAFAMVRSYIEATTDAATVASFRFVRDAPQLDTDQMLAGTLTLAGAEAALREALTDTGDGRARLASAAPILAGIAASGGRFGFDAFWQNGCAVSTPFLLVIDEAAGSVDGLDLAPCTE